MRDTPSEVNNTDCIICSEVIAVKCSRCQCHKGLLAVAGCFCIAYSSAVFSERTHYAIHLVHRSRLLCNLKLR